MPRTENSSPFKITIYSGPPREWIDVGPPKASFYLPLPLQYPATHASLVSSPPNPGSTLTKYQLTTKPALRPIGTNSSLCLVPRHLTTTPPILYPGRVVSYDLRHTRQ
ncbi:hypothetical protein ARMSODRAFT_960723 [Armillaria solidipes]|uniref:Uncharacterized protein n=1 Tax=Armillaria solidipes TaxID=1076256 RepID=A0A2H3B4K5_9AGAR|nr:hypothetical protein ARMSODRAFT_960723 [Armillaria solidipes]